MTKHSGKAYEGKARAVLSSWGIFAIGLQPDASPDLILPAYHIGLEIKSTRSSKYYASKSPSQYEYLKDQFPIDWPGYEAYYLIYFTKIHEWKIFSMVSKSPFIDLEGLSLNKFIDLILSEAKIVYKKPKYKNEVEEWARPSMHEYRQKTDGEK
jgi:hypothetical protein